MADCCADWEWLIRRGGHVVQSEQSGGDARRDMVRKKATSFARYGASAPQFTGFALCSLPWLEK
jgi:hypothetical protein